MDCIDTAYVVKVASKLVVADCLWESNFADEIASLLVQVLLDIRPNDDVYKGGLTNLVKV